MGAERKERIIILSLYTVCKIGREEETERIILRFISIIEILLLSISNSTNLDNIYKIYEHILYILYLIDKQSD